jgi:SAM-dependent methyltransferase
VERESLPLLENLQQAMTEWYSHCGDYYQTIDFTRDNWTSDLAYQWIADAAQSADNILEIGCGRANILLHQQQLASRYTGVDFSEDLIASNRQRFPDAMFKCIRSPAALEYDSGQFDLVIAIFVIEHCVFPHLALDEWIRVLKSGGRLVILCPDFLGRGLISSQRVGFSEGTGREKLSRGDIFDAIATALDTRVRMSLKAMICRYQAKKRPRFFINLAPTCFVDPFRPDVDAVYLTYKPEIISWTTGRILHGPVAAQLREHIRTHRLLIIDGKKS